MKRELMTVLQECGLSEKESAVYLALLSLGRAKAAEISTAAKIHRATTYTVLESMVEKWLVTPSMKDGERYFSAEPPSRIWEMMQHQKDHLAEIQEKLRGNLASFEALHNRSNKKPKIRYIEGVDGLRQMQREYESLEGDILQMIGYDTFLALGLHKQKREHVAALSQRKRKIRSILVTKNNYQGSPSLDLELRIIPPDLIDVRGEMTVCGDRLILFSYVDGLVAVDIDSRAIAQTARGALELAWRKAGDWQKKK